jgi:hypothetical protein
MAVEIGDTIVDRRRERDSGGTVQVTTGASPAMTCHDPT